MITPGRIEGFAAVSKHTYFDQAHATAVGVRNMYERSANAGKNFPTLTSSILAAPDEFGHLEGVVQSTQNLKEYCFTEKDAMSKIFFKLLKEDLSNGKKTRKNLS